MMKRIFSVLLICLFLFSMVACGEKKNTKGEDYGTIDWSTIQLGYKLPTPDSTKGKIVGGSGDSFTVYIADTTKAQYSEYIDRCKDVGFTVDQTVREDRFNAYDSDGYHLNISYKDDDIMRISFNAPQEDEPKAGSETTDNDKPLDNPPTTSEGVSADFKALMDSYEEFFDSYVAFMKKYKASTDQVSMMSDLADYMTKYADMMEKLNAIDSKSLSDADAAYYAEVSARVMKKLAEVA